MCGRFTLRTSPETLSSLFEDLNFPKLKPRYNIAPTQDVLCVRQNSRSEKQEAVFLRWGLVPFWAKDLKMGARMINARSETVATKPSFRSPFKKRRCLVLADGFYEWKKIGKEKQPFYITRTNSEPFCMAGLWESWRDKEEPEQSEPVETCTILTTDANATMQPLHDRMPVILNEEDFDFWLDTSFQDVEKLQKALVPCDPEEIHARPVSRVVNKATHDVAECIEPIELEN